MESSHLREFALNTSRSLTVALTSATLMFMPFLPLPPANARSIGYGSTPLATDNLHKHLPFAFEPNVGQTASEVRFISRASNHTLFLTPQEAVLEFAATDSGRSDKLQITPQAAPLPEPDLLRMKFNGANPAAEIVGLNRLPGTRNYLVGNDSTRWRTDVPTFQQVRYADIYRGVDLIYYGNQSGELEYDLVLASGADPSVINLSFEGAQTIDVDDAGDLVLRTRSGSIRQRLPAVYQQIADERTPVAARYKLTGNNSVSFQVADYDAGKPLVIDPVLSFATYLGGSLGEASGKIAVDTSGNIYLTGSTFSTNFPHQGQLPPSVHSAYNFFITKLNPQGNSIVFSTFFGGGGSGAVPESSDVIRGIAVDSSSNIYLTGSTSSLDFPTTTGAFQVTHGPNADGVSFSDDAFITKLNSHGNGFIYSTFIGGSSSDSAGGIAVDADGNAYVAGSSFSLDFPTTVGAFQTVSHRNDDAFVLKLNPEGSALLYSTFLGGEDMDSASKIAIDDVGNAYVGGGTRSLDFPVTYAVTPRLRYIDDAFVAKLSPNGSELIYSVCLGSSGEDTLRGLAIDAWGNAFITGITDGNLNPRYGQRLFPMRNAIQSVSGGDWEGFVTKINAAGTDLIYSTYLGGSWMDYCEDIAVDPMGNAYVAGYTLSRDFETKHPLQDTCACSGDDGDGFLVRLAPDGQQYGFATFIGGSSDDSATSVAVDRFGSAYVLGWTRSTQFPTQDPLQQSNHGSYDLFILKIGNPTITDASVIGKKLYISGENFDGSVILLDGEEQTTKRDGQYPSERLIAKKAGKKISVGQTVTLKVRNRDGSFSTEFKFTRTE